MYEKICSNCGQKLSDFAFSWFIVVDYNGGIFYMLFGFYTYNHTFTL